MVCREIFERGLVAFPDFLTTRRQNYSPAFMQIRLTFHEQGPLKIFWARSARNFSSDVWLIRLRNAGRG
jgi:hypothetical protein